MSQILWWSDFNFFAWNREKSTLISRSSAPRLSLSTSKVSQRTWLLSSNCSLPLLRRLSTRALQETLRSTSSSEFLSDLLQPSRRLARTSLSTLKPSSSGQSSLLPTELSFPRMVSYLRIRRANSLILRVFYSYSPPISDETTLPHFEGCPCRYPRRHCDSSWYHWPIHPCDRL